MSISKANFADLPVILTLQKLAYQSEAVLHNDFNLPPLLQTLSDLEAQYQTHLILKYVQKAELVGSVRAFVKEDVCQIGRLIVDPQYQGQGIGTQLLAAIEQAFSTCTRYQLFTGIKSVRNVQLYQRLGYQITQQTDQLIFLEKLNT